MCPFGFGVDVCCYWCRCYQFDLFQFDFGVDHLKYRRDDVVVVVVVVVVVLIRFHC